MVGAQRLTLQAGAVKPALTTASWEKHTSGRADLEGPLPNCGHCHSGAAVLCCAVLGVCTVLVASVVAFSINDLRKREVIV